MTARTRLAPLRKDHAEATFRWVSDPGLQKSFMMRKPPEWRAHLDHFDRVLAAPDQRAFAVLHNDMHVGNCGLKNLGPDGSGELWIYVGEASARGQGVGAAALGALIQVAFDELGLEIVTVHLRADNEPARKLYARCGFALSPLAGEAEWCDRDVDIIRMTLRRQ